MYLVDKFHNLFRIKGGSFWMMINPDLKNGGSSTNT